MEKDKSSPSSDYVEGFNYGYRIREENPDLALSLGQTKFPDSEKEYQEGLIEGISKKELELIKSKGRTSPSKSKDIDIER